MLEASHLTCRRNGRVLFAPLSFSLKAGETMALRGPNGSGKTSLLRACAGLLPHEGTVTRRADFCLAGHRGAVQDELTAGEHLDFWRALCPSPSPATKSTAMGHPFAGQTGCPHGPSSRKLRWAFWQARPAKPEARQGGGNPVEAKPHPGKSRDPDNGNGAPVFAGAPDDCTSRPLNNEALLERLGLAHLENEPVFALSHGQRQRLSLARLLIWNAPLWLLDEPAAALDDAGRAIFLELLAAHGARGGAALIAGHGDLPGDMPSLVLERPASPKKPVRTNGAKKSGKYFDRISPPARGLLAMTRAAKGGAA